jgi:hypothetical protein
VGSTSLSDPNYLGMSWHLKLGTINNNNNNNNNNANPTIDNLSYKFSLFCQLFFEGLKNGKKCAFKSEIIILLLSKKLKLKMEKNN